MILSGCTKYVFYKKSKMHVQGGKKIYEKNLEHL